MGPLEALIGRSSGMLLAIPPFPARRLSVVFNNNNNNVTIIFLYEDSLEDFLGSYEGLLLSACK
jgi:hypothetical protein